MLYDPPAGWRYGFPKLYLPLTGETIEQTLLRDGYPQHEIDNAGAKYVRFLGSNPESHDAQPVQQQETKPRLVGQDCRGN